MNFQRNTTTQPPSPSSSPPSSPPCFLNQVHQQLCLNLSSLSLNNNPDRRSFLSSSLDYKYDELPSPIVGEGFINSPYRAANYANYNNGVYSGVRYPTVATVDPRVLQHYQYQYQYPSFGASTSGFDPRFDFDRRAYLLAKEQQVYKNYAYKKQSNQVLRRMSLKELEGMIYCLAKDQNGCRILQEKFQNPTKEEVMIVLYEVMGSIADLMKDQFGNYIIQKLVSVCNDEQMSLIVRELTEISIDIILVSMTPNGSKSVQKLLENLKSRNQIMTVIRALEGGVAKLATDQNGHNVIQYCLLNFDNDCNQLILNEIADNCYTVATDRHGCCVVQTSVEHSHGEFRNRLIIEIINNAIHIAEDPFGNYVLQHMVGLKSPELTELLVRQLRGNFATLSEDKYASNVVEKCLTESGPDISKKIIHELLGSPNPASLLVHPYGNFVIQSALKVSKGFAYEGLKKLISSNVSSMHSNLYGKKILERIEKRRDTQI